jgi:hypothetical protein
MCRMEKLSRYTERAIRATNAGKLIPSIVYLPRLLRGQPVRLTEDNMRLTTQPPTLEENYVKIAKADPVGMLIAMMHGQPIPAFTISEVGEIFIKYEMPELELRYRIARFLAGKVTRVKAGPGAPNGAQLAEHDAMVSRALAADREEDDADAD